MADLELVLTRDDRVVRLMAPDELPNLSEAVLFRVREAAAQIKDRLVRELRRELRQDFEDRPRSSGYDGNTTLIIHHIEKALADSQVSVEGSVVNVLVFNLLYMDLVTRNQGRWTENEGWFMKRIRDGQGRTGGSVAYGFISLKKALELARVATANDTEKERQEFISYVTIHFAGRHTGTDEQRGIMTPLDKPLFISRPNFGTARDHGVVPHPGSLRWTALKDLDGPDNAKQSGGQHWMLSMIEKAVSNGMMNRS